MTLTVATGLLRMGLAAWGEPGDEVLAQALQNAPKIIREHGELLEPVARTLSAGPLLDNAVQLYQRLVERAIGGRDRDHYAEAGTICKVIRAIRRVQGREADFERYYQGLLATYSRFSALKDELRKAVERPGRSK